MGVSEPHLQSPRYTLVLAMSFQVSCSSSAIKSGSIFNISLCTPSFSGALFRLERYFHLVLIMEITHEIGKRRPVQEFPATRVLSAQILSPPLVLADRLS